MASDITSTISHPRWASLSRRTLPGWLSRIIVLLAMGLLGQGPLGAQEPDTLLISPDTLPAQERVELPELDEGTTPGGAFLRAVLVPGWGHASIRSYTRGGFYVLAESATGWMLARTLARLGAAKDLRDLREGELRFGLAAGGVTDPQEVDPLLTADPGVDDARDLVDARRQQFEDWLALGIFLVFLSGADAFVSAHLQDFPEPVRVELRGVPGGAELGLALPVGGAGRHP